MTSSMTFVIDTPGKVIDIDATADAVLSFEAVGAIASGDVYFAASTDGVTFNPALFYSFVSNALKTDISSASGFANEERGSIDVLKKAKARISSSGDFQGKLTLNVCEVPDALETTSTVFKSLFFKEGTQPVWTPAPGKSFVLMGYMVGVIGDTIAPSSPIGVGLVDDGANMGQNHLISVPTALQNTAVSEPLYVSPWISLGNGQKSSSPGNALQATLSQPLTSGQVYIIVSGREE